MEAGKRTLNQIIHRDRILEIPFFQRSYVWTEDNWERFLNDMKTVSHEKKEYFMGSVILKQKKMPTDSVIGDCRAVVDGQQRLTTLTLFFKALYRAHNVYEEFSLAFINRAKIATLQHNHNDISAFETIVLGPGDQELSTDFREKHRDSKVLACYDYFRSKEQDLREMHWHILWNNIYFVGIDLGSDEDEQQIFDTINSLGVSLTTAELLKNDLFKRNDEDLFNRTWKVCFESENKGYWSQKITAGRQRRENIDLLLQAFLLLRGEGKDKYTRLDSLFKNYKLLIKDQEIDDETVESRETFIRSLIDHADVYKRHINPRLTSETIGHRSSIERLNLIIFGLNTTTVIPYLIYLFKEVSDAATREAMFQLLENYLVRRLVCKETTKNYNNLFISFIRNKVHSYPLLHDKIYNAENQTDIFPDDASFRKAFYDNNLTNQQAKTVLYLMEISMRDPHKESTAVLGLDRYSLEHIMPKKWRNHWEKGLSEEEARMRDQALLKLGNLTIITSSLNSSIRDQSWERKKTGLDGKRGLGEYSKGIKIFDTPDYLHAPVWNEDKINERANFLSQKALEIWPYEALQSHAPKTLAT